MSSQYFKTLWRPHDAQRVVAVRQLLKSSGSGSLDANPSVAGTRERGERLDWTAHWDVAPHLKSGSPSYRQLLAWPIKELCKAIRHEGKITERYTAIFRGLSLFIGHAATLPARDQQAQAGCILNTSVRSIVLNVTGATSMLTTNDGFKKTATTAAISTANTRRKSKGSSHTPNYVVWTKRRNTKNYVLRMSEIVTHVINVTLQLLGFRSHLD